MTSFSGGSNMSGRRELNKSIYNNDPFSSASKIFAITPAFLPCAADASLSVSPQHTMLTPNMPQIVKHDYTDHCLEQDDGKKHSTPRGGVSVPFPTKLHELLDRIEQDGLADVVSWQPHGRCFAVHKQQEFADHFMPKYFKQSKFASFQRQLNLYGFRRLTRHGADKGAYYHELFLRGRLFLAHRIPRMRVKGTGVRARSNPDSEPSFYTMPYCLPWREDTKPSAIASKTPKSLSPMCFDVKSPSDDEDLKLDFAGRLFHTIDDEVKLTPPGFFGDEDNLLGSPDISDEFLQQINVSKSIYDDIDNNVGDDTELGDLLERLLRAA